MDTLVNETKDETTVISNARNERREQIAYAAKMLTGSYESKNFDPVHANLCAIDVVMIAGSPWLKEALEKDYTKDESGYKKIGGGANTPKMAYFFRSATNLMHFLKRQGLYIPRGAKPNPSQGMACFLDWDDRGRFNFAPDRCGVIVSTKGEHIEEIVLPCVTEQENYEVRRIKVAPKTKLDLAIIGYSDLP